MYGCPHTPTHLVQGKTALNFLYAKPPGMAEAEAAQQAAAGDDEAVKEFYRKYVDVFTQTKKAHTTRRCCVCARLLLQGDFLRYLQSKSKHARLAGWQGGQEEEGQRGLLHARQALGARENGGCCVGLCASPHMHTYTPTAVATDRWTDRSKRRLSSRARTNTHMNHRRARSAGRMT